MVDASESDRQCRLRISDTGPGIPDTTRKKMFQLYFTTKPGGSDRLSRGVSQPPIAWWGHLNYFGNGKRYGFEIILPTLQAEAVASA